MRLNTYYFTLYLTSTFRDFSLRGFKNIYTGINGVIRYTCILLCFFIFLEVIPTFVPYKFQGRLSHRCSPAVSQLAINSALIPLHCSCFDCNSSKRPSDGKIVDVAGGFLE